MSRPLPSGLAGIVLTAALAAVSGSAVAYFTADGVGQASAGVAKLSAPTITAITPAVGGTVSLSWSSVTAPGSGTVKYYVTRDGGDPGGTCAAPAVPAAAVSCKDSEVGIGTHDYTVTAVWRSWTATSSTSSAGITIGAPTHFTITPATLTPAVAAADNLTIAAKDEAENTVTIYTGSHSLVFSGASSSPNGTAPTVTSSSGSAINFGKSTSLNFTAGVASVSSSKNGLMKLFRAEQAEIVATESSSSLTTTSPPVVTVIPGAASKYTLAGTTTTPAAGAESDLTITALDTYGNTATAYTGSHGLVFSGASASPAGNLPTVADESGNEIAFGTATPLLFEAGIASVGDAANGTMRLYKSGSASVKATEGSLNTPTALGLTVAAGTAANLVLTSSTATPVAAASSNLTTTAKDVYGNNATAYTGSHNLVFSGASVGPAGNAPTVVNGAGTAVAFGAATALNFNSGVASVSNSKNGLMRLYKAGATSVSVTDGTISTSASLALSVGVGTAGRWALTTVAASAGTIGSPCLFTCPITGLGNGGTVSARLAVSDSAGNTVSNLGTGTAAKVTANGGSLSGGASLPIPATGLAISEAQFTYTAPVSGSFNNTITASSLNGSSYTNATATASK